jgi:hypothetical protein
MRPLGIVVVIATAVLVSACATRIVSSHVEPDTDFARYRTYDWGPADALPTGDARLDNNELFRDDFQGAVEKALARGISSSRRTSPTSWSTRTRTSPVASRWVLHRVSTKAAWVTAARHR